MTKAALEACSEITNLTKMLFVVPLSPICSSLLCNHDSLTSNAQNLLSELLRVEEIIVEIYTNRD